MKVTYQLTASDFLQGMQAYRRKSASGWFIRVVVILMLVVSVLGILTIAMNRDRQSFNSFQPFFILTAVWCCLYWGAPYLSARRQFRGSPSANAPTTLGIDDSGLRFGSQHADSSVAWSAFVKYLEGKDVIALFTSPLCFKVIPKRAFTAEQLTQFRETIQRNIQLKK